MHTSAEHVACYQAFDAKGVGSLLSAALTAVVVVALVFGERRRNGIHADICTWYLVFGERRLNGAHTDICTWYLVCTLPPLGLERG